MVSIFYREDEEKSEPLARMIQADSPDNSLSKLFILSI